MSLYLIGRVAEEMWWEAPPQPLPAPTVFPVEPVFTGLVTPEGERIWRGPDPIGFLRFEEKS